MQVHFGMLAELRVAARDRHQNLVLAARERVASKVAKAGLAKSANLSESKFSTTTEWWRSRVRAAETIEEVSRFTSELSQDEAAPKGHPELHRHFFRVGRRCRVAGRPRGTPGVFQEQGAWDVRPSVFCRDVVGRWPVQRGGKRRIVSPTVDLVVSSTAELIGHWSTETESEVIPETLPPPGMVAACGVSEGAVGAPDTRGAVPAEQAKASAREVLEKAAARELLESLVREQERQERQVQPKFLAPTPKIAKPKPVQEPRPSVRASLIGGFAVAPKPKPSKKAAAPEPEQSKRRLPPPRAVAAAGATSKPAPMMPPPPPPAAVCPPPRVQPKMMQPS